MLKITNDTITSIVKRIASEANPEKIILFGSHAKELANDNSDIDLLIIEKEGFEKRSRFQEIRRIRNALAPIKHAKDILVYSTAEVNKWKNSLNHIISTCLNEGKVIYERS